MAIIEFVGGLLDGTLRTLPGLPPSIAIPEYVENVEALDSEDPSEVSPRLAVRERLYLPDGLVSESSGAYRYVLQK